MADHPLSELVFGTGYPTNNRWREDNEIIQIESIRTPEQLPSLIGNLRNLRRVKIFELEREPVHELLDALGAIDQQRGNLLELEIEQLILVEGTTITYAFAALEVLSIDRVHVLNAAGERPVGPLAETTILFNAPYLDTVSLGNCSAHYVRFSHPQSPSGLILDQPPSDLTIFRNLEALDCNQIELFDLRQLSLFISGQVGKLNELNVRTANFADIFGAPFPAHQIRFLENFYACLRSAHHRPIGAANGALRNGAPNGAPPNGAPNVDEPDNHPIGPDDPRWGRFALRRIRPGLSILFNGVELNLQRLQFADYHFDKPLIEMYAHNISTNRLEVCPQLSVWQADYYTVFRFLYSREQVFQGFANLFPNVRKVIVCHGVSGVVLLQFFEACRGLRELHFVGARLLTNAYDRITRMDSCRTLKSLMIIEPDTVFTHLIDFTFIGHLPLLRYFCTNVAPREQMYACLERMRSHANQLFAFRFGFEPLPPGQTFHRFIFRKTDDQAFKMAVHTSPIRNFEPLAHLDWSQLQIHNLTMAGIRSYLNDPANAHMTSHWIRPNPINGQAPQAPVLNGR